MFSIIPSLTFLEAGPEQVVFVAESINHPHVGVPGREAQATQGYVVGLRGDDGIPAVYVYLWLSRTREAVVYGRPADRLDDENYPQAEQDAIEFCESMGFMMEGMQFRELNVQAQEEILRNLPPFLRAPAPPRLAGSKMLQETPPGPSMNSNFVTAATPGPEDFIELLEPLDERDEPPVDTEKLARLLASF